MNIQNIFGAVSRARTASWWRMFAIGIVTVSILGLAIVAEGKGKPVKPPPPPPAEGGILYLYTQYEPSLGLVEEYDLDAGVKTALFTAATRPSNIAPSKCDHNGRWFAVGQLVPGLLPEYPPLPGYSWDRPRSEMFAVHESGTAVQLTFDPSFEAITEGWGVIPQWVDNDRSILFFGRRLDLATGAVVAETLGLYELGIDFSNGTAEPVGVPTLIESSLNLPKIGVNQSGYGEVMDIMGMDVTADEGTLYISQTTVDGFAVGNVSAFDLATGVDSGFLTTSMTGVRISPNQDAIIGTGVSASGTDPFDYGVVQANMDGTGYTTIVANERRTNVGEPVWSHTGASIAYVVTSAGSRNSVGTQAIVTANADGSNAVTIISGYYWAHPLGWFAAP